jgi:hypothetical protein
MNAFEPNYDETRVPAYLLPDPLLTCGGRAVKGFLDWQQERRPEILGLFKDHVYGQTPSVAAKVKVVSTASHRSVFSGLAVRKEVRLQFSTGTGSRSMDLLIYLPAGSRGPAPVFLALNFWGNHSIHPDPEITLSSRWMPSDASYGIVDHRATPESRGRLAHRWPLERILSRGYGLATAYCGDLAPDHENLFRQGAHSLFASAEAHQASAARGAAPAAAEWGAIGAWAWGLSRAMDYFEEDELIDHNRVAVLGHSRLGKAALWAAAQDERFAMVVSNNSGCGGAALSRRLFGETVEAINDRFPHWFCGRFKSYGTNPASLPLDQHMLLALIAPRPLYVASAEEDLWADPRGEFLAARAAHPVYVLLGTEGLTTDAMPPAEVPVMSTLGYHIRPGGHDLTGYDWRQFLAFADRYL